MERKATELFESKADVLNDVKDRLVEVERLTTVLKALGGTLDAVGESAKRIEILRDTVKQTE